VSLLFRYRNFVPIKVSRALSGVLVSNGAAVIEHWDIGRKPEAKLYVL
jgi:hypothetical protein